MRIRGLTSEQFKKGICEVTATTQGWGLTTAQVIWYQNPRIDTDGGLEGEKLSWQTSLVSQLIKRKNPIPAAYKTNSQNTTEDSSLQDYVVKMRMWGNEGDKFNNAALPENFTEQQ